MIRYADVKTGKEIAPRVTTEIKYQRDLKAWQSNETTIFEGLSNKDVDQYDVSWSQNAGPLIRVSPGDS